MQRLCLNPMNWRLIDMDDQWLLEQEPDFYKETTGRDPYAIFVTKLSGLNIQRIPARLLSYADKDDKTAHVIYLDGTRGIVYKEQMSPRGK